MITTLEYANRLKEKGCEPQLAEEFAKLYGETNDDLVTKSYLKETLQNFKNEILVKLGGLMVVGMTILGFILKH